MLLIDTPVRDDDFDYVYRSVWTCGNFKNFGEAQHREWKCSYRSLINVYIWVLSKLQNAILVASIYFGVIWSTKPLSLSKHALNPERLPRAKGSSCIQCTIKQQQCSSPPPWITLSPLLPLSNLLPFSPIFPGYTPYGRDPSRLLHLLNSIFRFQQSNLEIPTPLPSAEHVSGSKSHILYPISLSPGFIN